MRGERLPGDAAVLGAEESLRRGAGVPDVRLARVARREPERVIDRAAFLAVRRLRERGRPRGFLPGAPEIGGAENGRTEVPGLRRRQQRSPVARVEHEMADDVAEKVRAVDPPGLSCRIAVIQPRAFARGDEDQHPAC